MDISATIANDLYTVLDLDTFSVPERTEFLNSIGELVFETAVLRYLDTVPEDEQSIFGTWVQAHEHDPKLIERLGVLYPAFAKILLEEVAAFKNDALRVMQQTPSK